ncbi:MAG: replication-associated recombination protein A [Desulfomonilaceae bacterium]|nr:replication-associated recombination protein A [Desulfomonilaceae bacterium]
MDLFDRAAEASSGRPLADRMRPRSPDEVLGQESLIGPGKILRRAIEEDRIFSMLFWGPPGTGKTTLAQIIARISRSTFVPYSAVTVGVKEIREVAKKARDDLKYLGRKTILFLDEIHRFNKSQQDYLLPHVEDGTLVLIGATTENPSFEVNSALLSRLRVFVLQALPPEALRKILHQALADGERGLGELGLEFVDGSDDLIVSLSGGDARTALNILDVAALDAHRRGIAEIPPEIVHEAVQKRNLLYDKSGEEHFNLISALHKSIRDSDPDAGLYWMARMLEGGEDPVYIARRLVRFASEDVGLASPRALEQAVAAFQACRYIGMPECALALAQAVVFLAVSPKSNALEAAYIALKEEIARSGHLPVPLHLRNAPTGLMKGLGYGKGYKYAHDFPDAVVDQQHLPDELLGTRFYEPTDRGYEKTIKETLEKWEKGE